jgi:hypothetical protein
LEHVLGIAEHRAKTPAPPHRLGTAPAEHNEW